MALRSILTGVILLTATVPSSASCLTGKELLELNQSMVCQQLQNPKACHELSVQLEEEWTQLNLLDERVYKEKTNNSLKLVALGTGALVAGAGVAAASTYGAKATVRKFVEYRNGLRESTNLIKELRSDPKDAKKLGKLAKSLAKIQSSPLYKSTSTTGKRLSESKILTWLKNGSKVVGRGALSLLGAVAAPLTVISAVKMLDDAYVYYDEKKSGCDARFRNADLGAEAGDLNALTTTLSFACMKENCSMHHTNCAKAFNFVAGFEFADQAAILDAPENIHLCEYMKDHLKLAPKKLDGVTLKNCNANGAVEYSIDNFTPSPVDDVAYTKWEPNEASGKPKTFTLEVSTKTGESLDSLAETNVSIRPALRQHLNILDRLQFRYDDTGNLSTVAKNISDFTANPAYAQIPGFKSRLAWPKTLAQIEKIISPPNDRGLLAGLSQGGWTPESRWIYEQEFLMHKKLSQIHSEVIRCCEGLPDASGNLSKESCKIDSLTAPKDAEDIQRATDR